MIKKKFRFGNFCPTQESILAALRIKELELILDNIEAFKTFDRDCEKLAIKLIKAKSNEKKINKVIDESIDLVVRHRLTNFEKYENIFKEREKEIDRKFWNKKALERIAIILYFGMAQTIKDAVRIYEDKWS